jgi:GTP diphosphokinase / guanosine-3',5'-bis(diphosphate) 3'-diphosphatase
MLCKLIEKIDNNCLNVNKDLVTKAYEFACAAHEVQKRESGEPYIVHPFEVACILADMGMDTNTIAAGLLHDVIEDTEFTHENLTNEFNLEIANLVEGVTKLTKLGKMQYKSKQEQQADNVRKMVLAMTKDIRVILIKLADRLHNMRTLKFMAPDKQKEKAKETFDIYAPLAHRLGMSKIKWELEDLAFRYSNPEEYYDLVKKIVEKRVEREAYIGQIIKDLKENLSIASIYSDIDGRPKHFYSIHRKMINKNKAIDQIFDLTAVRILVDTVKDCYAALGIVHTMYKPIPGRFKDYIAMPKPNMYQSLHSTVIGPQGKPFEIQIRTFEMHKTAEYGIAAHWKYKENSNEDNGDFETRLSWLGDMLEWQRETSDAEEFMEAFKIDLFSDEVFVFTPKGAVIDLPSEATPIDFAYRIHTDIGNRCIGAKVNGKMVPLDYHLSTGEIIEIMTSTGPKGPSIDWLNMAKSNQAKSKIRAWFKKAKREENIGKGKELLEKDAKRQGCNFGEIAKGDALDKLLKRYNMNILDDLYAAVGMGALMASVVVSKLKESFIKANKTAEADNTAALKDIEEQISKSSNKTKKEHNYGVAVKGVENVLVRFAKCCNPVPGDEIIGYITKGRGVSVHRKDCKNAEALLMDSEPKIVEVSWGGLKGPGYVTEIQIQAEDRSGMLSEIMIILTESKIHLHAVNAKTSNGGLASVSIKLKINDIDELKDIMKKIRKLKGVLEVYRTRS